VSRGRRLECGGFGAFGGAFFATLLPWLGIGYALALIAIGVLLQVRAERKRRGNPPRVEITQGGERLDGKEREEALWEQSALLAWEAAGRPGLPTEPSNVEANRGAQV
jgi:hypothetical protein